MIFFSLDSNINVPSGSSASSVHSTFTDFDINIISPLQQDTIGSGNLLTPDGRTIDDAIDDEEETKS
ncbi:unnamed protein product [Rotaria sordida]|uniref:Uncharacterized protein n=1 Tax=Rotaria sordida TaxID=392033 RepID=A0A819BXV2_9BILA|nr:unnamed protein product [Rotaria sordida]CAF1456020.1 unnamed protein product [Rotaria sordida]CAF1585398.1 unnamed protein product [Rotaria sordida]CAF3808531.1 unnamed protein product [Rotaria sordida]CAF4336986.1 unnamed protein product [Rotaria sordida]